MVRLTVRVDPSPPPPPFYNFKMEKIGPKFSHLLTVRAVKIPFFFTTALIQLCKKKRFFWGSFRNITVPSFIASLLSCAWPLLGVVQKYKFLKKYSPLVSI